MMAAGVRIQNGQSKIRNRLDSETSCGEALTGLLFFAFAPDGRGYSGMFAGGEVVLARTRGKVALRPCIARLADWMA